MVCVVVIYFSVVLHEVETSVHLWHSPMKYIPTQNGAWFEVCTDLLESELFTNQRRPKDYNSAIK